MKFELSKRDLKDIECAVQSTSTLYLKKVKEQKFEIGEILIRKTVEYKDSDCKEVLTETVEKYNNSQVDERFVVVHRDEETNTHYLRSITEEGKMNKSMIHSTYDPNDHVGYRYLIYYETDPRAVDAILMGEDLDLSSILKEEKARKNKLIEMNRESSVVFTSLKDINKWAKQLKANQLIWYHECSDHAFRSNEYKTIKLKKDPRRIGMNDFTKQEHYDWKLRRGDYSKSLHKSADCIYMLVTSREGAKITTADLLGKAIYTSQPIDLKGMQ